MAAKEPENGSAENSDVSGEDSDLSEDEKYSILIPVTCDGDDCQGGDLIGWYCKQCPCNLCDSCKTKHQASRMTGNHEIVARTGPLVQLRRKTKDICPIHKTTEITLFCNDCDVECCLSCLEDAHQRHSVVSMEKILSEAARSLKSRIAKLEDVTIPRLKENLNLYNSDSPSFQEQSKIAKEALEEERKECIKMINDMYDKKLESYDRCVGKTKSDIESKISDSHSKVKDLRDTLYSDKLSIIRVHRRTKEDEFSYGCFHKDVPVFSFLYPAFRVNGLNNIQINQAGYFEETEVEVAILNKFDIPEIVVCVRSGMPGNMLIASARFDSFDQGLDAKFHTLDEYGNMTEKFHLEEDSYITDFFVSSSDEIVFTDRYRVRKLSENGKLQTLIDKKDSFEIKSVCPNTNKELVACIFKNSRKSHLAILSIQDVRKIKEIRVRRSEDFCPEKVKCNGSDYCFSDFYGVIAVNELGEFRWDYTNLDREIRECRKPFSIKDICCDKLRNILALDNKNKCIHYLDKDGNLLGFLVTRQQHGVEHFISADIQNDTLWITGTNTDAKESKVALIKYFN